MVFLHNLGLPHKNLKYDIFGTLYELLYMAQCIPTQHNQKYAKIKNQSRVDDALKI
jgi:hypothetical protein